MFWTWKELYISTSYEDTRKICDALRESGVKYKFKSQTREQGGALLAPARNILGKIGERDGGSCLYYIHVKKTDYEKAKQVIK